MSTRICHTTIDGASAPNATSAAIDSTGATLLVIGVSSYTPAGAYTITDSEGNTWHPLTSKLATRYTAQLWYAWNPNVGTGHTFTISNNVSGNMFFTGNVAGFDGIGIGADPFDVENGATSASGDTNMNAGSATPTTAASLVVTFFGMDDPSGNTPTCTGYTVSDFLDGVAASRFGGALAYLSKSGTSAENPHWTRTTTNSQGTDAAVVAVFTQTPTSDNPPPADPAHSRQHQALVAQ